ncbi:hypothetical protein [Negadavirga shengliensis]|uniref:Uncharacterized protein n=1 Tax=Negadavirga shengliensis TaxID=1389218 RepID=A0ABV9T4U8_9BACT
MDRNRLQDLVFLLREYVERIHELKPAISWNTYEIVPEKMNSIVNKIENEIEQQKTTYDLCNFWFSDFNGKSPEGEVLEYVNMMYPELKELKHKIEHKIQEIIK